MAGRSATTVAVPVGPPLTVRRKLPLGTPLPVRGTRVGELVSVLAMVRVPVRAPRTVGVKVTVMGQLEPGVRVVVEQGAVTA